MDPALQELVAEGTADDEVAVILRLAEGAAPPEGARIVTRFGSIATCRLRRGDIPRVRSAEAVLSMKAAHLYGPTPSESGAEPAASTGLNDDDLFTDAELPIGALPGDQRRPSGALPTGRGVVIAHIDWGVDFAHPDFRDASGHTRLLALWDQSQSMDPARPNRYGYGRIYDRSEIDRALATPQPYATLGYWPADADGGGGTHGTHTLGISGGNGRAGGPTGIAPDAHLVFVHLSTYTADGPARLGDSVALLEAHDFIATVANGLSLVINESIGKHAGSHDGKTGVELGMDAFLLTAPGRAIVLSTGNYFKRDSHAHGVLRPGDSRILHLVADAPQRTPIEVDLWYPGVDRISIQVRGPDGVAHAKAGPGQKASLILDGREIGRLYHRIGDPNNGDNQATLFLYRSAPPAHWEIELVGDDIVDGRFHAWVERDAQCASCQAHFVAADADPICTIGTICNGLRTVAVGAYDAHRGGRPLGRFSSCGPTRDGRQKPDLVAPGVKVLAARSAPRVGAADAPLLTRMSGTSMAAPHVTGAIALMFEAAGRPLAIDETRRLLLGSSELIPADADAQDYLRTGSGFLDITAAVEAARHAGPAHAGTAPITISEPADGRKTIMNESSAGMSDLAGGRPATAAPDSQPEPAVPAAETAAAAGAADSAEADSAEATREKRGNEPAPLPFQVQLPIGGGAPAVALPFGGAGSPFAFTVPLGGTPAAAVPAPMPVVAVAPVLAAVAAVPGAPAPAVSTMAPITGAPDIPLYVAPAEYWAESGEPGARSLLQRGARGPSVQEAQIKLNIVHRRRLESGMPGLTAAPLLEDGIFGDLTRQATVSFQRLAFPDQPREWDGAIGPRTWAMLDALSTSVQPAPPPQPIDPPILPVLDAGCGNLLIWINAFIPGNVPGYTFTVPAGPHAGESAIPCPTAVATIANPNCFRLGYLTDQRGFDNRPSAPVRMRSIAEIQVLAPRLVRTDHVTSGTIEINRNTGAVTCTQPADMRRCSFTGFSVAPRLIPAGSYLIRLSYRGAASDPCVNLGADIDYFGDIEILCTPASNQIEVSVSGRVDSFPAFEMYASLGSVTLPLFTLPPPAGNTVVNLLGGASTPVAGRAVFNCSFGRADVPTATTTALASPIFATAGFAQSAQAEWAAAEAWPQETAFAGSEGFDRSAHECECGERLLAVAEAYAQPHASRPASAAVMLESLMEVHAGGEAVLEADQPGSASAGALPLSPTALFHAFAYPDHPLRPRSAQQRHYARRFEMLAGPGDRLPAGVTPRAGDLLVRVARGEGWGQVAVIATPGAHPLNRLGNLGMRAEGGQRPLPGSYVHVVEILPHATPASAAFARRLADAGSEVLGDTLLLRPRGAPPSGESAEAGCGCGTATRARPEAEATGYVGETVPGIAEPCKTLDRFARDSDQLLPVHRLQIEEAARAILTGHIHSVVVTGFASSDGSNEYNLALGQRRADRVALALRAALESQRPGSSGGVAISARSHGEEDQIAGGNVVRNRRVTICPSTPQPQPQPQRQPVRQRVFRITAKSFIGHIGSNVGTLSCGLDTPLGHVPSPLTNPALRAFAAATDLAFSEDPRTDNIFVVPPPENKGYRLFSSVRVRIEHRGPELLSATPVGGVLTDAGKECAPSTGACLQAPPLAVDLPFSAARIDAHRMRLTWAVRGRPPAVTDTAFNAICIRTSVFIWHRIKATVDCSSGVPVFTSLVVEGSHFPSHRLWLDGAQVHQVPQGPLSGLWDAEPGDPTRVH